MTPGDLPQGAGAAVALALGLIFGSFANVCIHRLPHRRSVIRPGSACPACRARIAWYDNIPILSWLALRGRCRACRAPIPIRYPLVEAASAALLLSLYARHGLTLRWAALSYLAVSILVLVPIDYRHGILPDRVTLTGLGVGLLASPLTPEPGLIGAIQGALMGGVVPLLVRALYIAYVRARSALAGSKGSPAGQAAARAKAGGAPGPADLEVRAPAPVGAAAPDPGAGGTGEADHSEERREGMGLGDVKMLAMVGAFLGTPQVLLTMLLGSVLGTLYVVPMVATGRHGMKTPVPFGPFLGMAAILSIYWGAPIIDWYLGLVVTLPLGG